HRHRVELGLLFRAAVRHEGEPFPVRRPSWMSIPRGPVRETMRLAALDGLRISVEMITQIGSVITRIGSRDHCGSGLETRCGPWALSLCSRAVAARPAVITGPIQADHATPISVIMPFRSR